MRGSQQLCNVIIVMLLTCTIIVLESEAQMISYYTSMFKST